MSTAPPARTPTAITPDVLVAAQRGDGDAVGVIWRELAPVVAGYLATRGAADPEGLTSDVFLAVLPRLPDLDGSVAGLRTFVFSVAHARLVDDTRRRARRPGLVEFDPAAHDRVAESAEAEALARSDGAAVQDLLAGLAPDHREVLALRVVADLGVEQTAAVMGRSIGSVKQLQRRALLALRAQLGTRVTTATPTATATRVTRPAADSMTDAS